MVSVDGCVGVCLDRGMFGRIRLWIVRVDQEYRYKGKGKSKGKKGGRLRVQSE